jgi:hypothetical protein
VYTLVPLLKDFFSGHFTRSASSSKPQHAFSSSTLTTDDINMSRAASSGFGFGDHNAVEPLNNSAIDIHFRVCAIFVQFLNSL